MRLPVHIHVGALLRRAAQQGGNAAVLARGDPDSGGLVVICRERGAAGVVLEAVTGPGGHLQMRGSGPGEPHSDEQRLADWIARRRRTDPDLWILELDVADAERLTAETIAPN